MKKKELINLIKDKADQVEIKNLSFEILSKVESQQNQKMNEEIEPTKHALNLKGFLFPSLSTVLAVFLFFFAFGLFSTPMNVDAYSESIALSTLSSVTKIETNKALLDEGFTGILLANEDIDPAKIETEIPKLETFFTWAEQLLVSDDSLSLNLLPSTKSGYQYQLTFETNDLLDDITVYEIYFNQSIKKQQRTMTLEGLIISNDLTYDFLASVYDKKGEITVIIKDDEGYEIELMTSIRDSEKSYKFKEKYQGEIKEEVTFKWMNEGLNKEINMEFSGRAIRGNYQFRYEQAMMRVNYQINNQTSEQGEMDIEVIQNEQGNFYGITIRVTGRPEISYGNVQRGRGRPDNPGNGRN